MRYLGLYSACALVLFASIAQSQTALKGGQPSVASSGDLALARLQSVVPAIGVFHEEGRVTRLYGVPMGNGFTPVQAAVAFVAENKGVFDPGMGDFVFTGTQDLMEGKFTVVYFRETVLGVPVDRGGLSVLVRNELGSPIVLVNSFSQNVALGGGLTRITASDAKTIVHRADPSVVVTSTPAIVAWQGEAKTHLAWTFKVSNEDLVEPKRFTVFVDSSNGRILEWRDEVYNANITGHVEGFATPGLAPHQNTNPPALADLSGLIVRVVGGSAAISDSLGDFTINHGGTGVVNVRADLVGNWVRVANNAGPTESLTQPVLPPGPASFLFNFVQDEFTTAQVNGFIHTTGVHNFAKAINSSYPGIDVAAPCNVNLASVCNAFYTNGTINFFQSETGDGETGCPNTAYTTVIYHEYGHFIIENGNPFATGDYHEGVADTTGALGLDDPCGGLDFLGSGTGCLRNAINPLTYPCVGPIHTCGQVISGAFWLTRLELAATEGSGPGLDIIRDLYLNSILLQPVGITPAITIDVLTLDDDDPIIWNGTPHYAEIAAGFGAKNLDAPPIGTTYDPIGVSTILGTFTGGNLASITTSDDSYYTVSTVLLPGLGHFGAIQVDFDIAESAASVARLLITVESSNPPFNTPTGTIYLWHWGTGQFHFVKSYNSKATDAKQYAQVVDDVSEYVGAGGEVRVAFRAHDPFRRDGARPQAFTIRTDMVHLDVLAP